MKIYLPLLLIVLSMPLSLWGQHELHDIHYTNEDIGIDGRLDERDWQKAEVIKLESEIRGRGFEPPQQETEVRMLWDEQFLYLHATVYEEHIVATLRTRDAIIYRDNDFEIFIDTDRDGKRYFEIEVNALNTIMDLYMDRPYKMRGNALLSFDIPLESAVYINGTLNNGNDTDAYWAVEIKIPKSHLIDHGEKKTIKDGETWLMNFSRVQWNYQWQGDRYQKVSAPGTEKFEEKNWVWYPTGKIDIHLPEKWATVRFIRDK